MWRSFPLVVSLSRAAAAALLTIPSSLHAQQARARHFRVPLDSGAVHVAVTSKAASVTVVAPTGTFLKAFSTDAPLTAWADEAASLRARYCCIALERERSLTDTTVEGRPDLFAGRALGKRCVPSSRFPCMFTVRRRQRERNPCDHLAGSCVILRHCPLRIGIRASTDNRSCATRITTGTEGVRARSVIPNEVRNPWPPGRESKDSSPDGSE